MDLNEIMETPIWGLFEKGRSYHRLTGIYTDTDRNHRFYNGNQWEGAKLGDVEPVQKNFIKPIVKYKVAVVHDNLYAIVYASQNYDNPTFRPMAERICQMLNNYAAKAWEQNKLDDKGREVTKDAAINDEGVLYIDFDPETRLPICEVLDKSDVYYANENDSDLQSQPYILIRRRMPVLSAIELAHQLGCTDMDNYIIGDNDTFEEPGEAAKQELDDNVTVVYKFYKTGGTVHFTVATKYVEFTEDRDMGITLYPIAHYTWESKKGSARGEGEVRQLIPNQIEVNRTEMRRLLTVKMQAYPQKVAVRGKITNPSALGSVGGVIWTNSQTVDDVHKIVTTLPPAQMSQDVVQLQYDLINVTRDLAGAGDSATGNVDPESASGRAILAVQQASQAPMTEQRQRYKSFVEDVASIFLEYLIAYAQGGIQLEEKMTDPTTGQESVQLVTVHQEALRQVQASVKIEVTPKSVYDRFAQEQTIENLMMNGLFHPERVNELEIYANLLDDDSVAPKAKILEAVRRIRENQARIAQIDAQAQMLQQRANQFLMGDPQEQASMMAAAKEQFAARQQAMPGIPA